MTVATDQQSVAPARAMPTRRASTGRMSVELAGFLTLLLGAWGALVPFIGPIWSWSADGTGSWTWDAAHAWLFLVPGVVAAIGGLMAMIGGATVGGLAKLGGLLAIVAGAWFIVGPIAWPILEGNQFFAGYSTLHQFGFWIGYSLGPGVLLTMLGAYIFGHEGRVASATKAPTTTAATY
jgi:hypothetical protein